MDGIYQTGDKWDKKNDLRLKSDYGNVFFIWELPTISVSQRIIGSTQKYHKNWYSEITKDV